MAAESEAWKAQRGQRMEAAKKMNSTMAVVTWRIKGVERPKNKEGLICVSKRIEIKVIIHL